MVDVPPHQIWCRSLAPTLRSDGANGTPKVLKLKICHLLAVPAALGKQSAAGCTPAVEPPAALKTVRDKFPNCSPEFYRGAKTPNFSPKFRPHSSSDRRSFDLRHSIENLKQTCQGPMVGVPPHQIWCRSMPPTLRSDGSNGTPKVHKLKICHLLAVPAALGKQSVAGCTPAVVPPAALKNCS